MEETKHSNILNRKKEIIIHGVFWAVYLFYSLVKIGPKEVEVQLPSIFEITWFIVFFSTFYLNYLILLPALFQNFKWKKGVLYLMFIFLFFTTFRYLLEQVLTKSLFGVQNYMNNPSIAFYISDNLYYGAIPVFLSFAFWIGIFMIRLLEFNQNILENRKNNEIKYLKSQINPHFVYNTLNNIYALIHFKSENALPSVEKLSQIMRFTTYQATKDKISIEEELDLIKAYIELEKLRIENENLIEFEVEILDKDIQVPPFLLLPLIENALKHGAKSGNAILAKLVCSRSHLQFTIENEIGKHQKDHTSGIGLENLKRRLEILYPNKNILNINQTEHIFKVNLKIEFA